MRGSGFPACKILPGTRQDSDFLSVRKTDAEEIFSAHCLGNLFQILHGKLTPLHTVVESGRAGIQPPRQFCLAETLRRTKRRRRNPPPFFYPKDAPSRTRPPGRDGTRARETDRRRRTPPQRTANPQRTTARAGGSTEAGTAPEGNSKHLACYRSPPGDRRPKSADRRRTLKRPKEKQQRHGTAVSGERVEIFSGYTDSGKNTTRP